MNNHENGKEHKKPMNHLLKVGPWVIEEQKAYLFLKDDLIRDLLGSIRNSHKINTISIVA